MKMILVGCIILCAAVFTGCKSAPKAVQPATPSNVVGNDRDDHGCIGSAGYQWSELLQDCIRPFEKGIRLTAVQDTTLTSAAYLVFNADSSKIEVFLPQKDERPILSKDAETAEKCWKSEAFPSLQVKYVEKKWAVTQNGESIYAE